MSDSADPDISGVHPACDPAQYSLDDFWNTADWGGDGATSQVVEGSRKRRRHSTAMYYTIVASKQRRRKTEDEDAKTKTMDEEDKPQLSEYITQPIAEIEEWIKNIRQNPLNCADYEIDHLSGIVETMQHNDYECGCCEEYYYTIPRPCFVCKKDCCAKCCKKCANGQYACRNCARFCYICKKHIPPDTYNMCYWCQRHTCFDHAKYENDIFRIQCTPCYDQHDECTLCEYKHRPDDTDLCEITQDIEKRFGPPAKIQK